MPKKILVVDDNRLIRNYIVNLFENRGHKVRQASSGISALSVLDGFTPHIIFLDIFMPHVNGKRLCRIIRRTDRLSGCRIVIISSALAELDDELDRIGADAFIAKEAFARMSPRLLAVVEPPQGAPVDDGAVGSVIDSPEEGIHSRRITRELLAINRHLEAVLANMSEGVIEMYEGKVVYVNEAVTRLLDLPEEGLLGHRLPAIFPPSCRSAIEKLLTGEDRVGRPCHRPLRINNRQVQVALLNTEALAGELFILRDVTDKNRILQQLIVSERKASAGLLSQAVAQEINSPVQGIMSTLNHLQRTYGEYPELGQDLEAIRTALEGIKKIGANLHAINRTVEGGQQAININDLVHDTIAISRALLKKNRCCIHTRLEPGLPRITGLPQRLQQVLLHLVGNAVEAITTDRQGTATGAEQLPAGEIGIETRSTGADVILVVHDTGPGIPEVVQEHLFELFVTSREATGKGVGLTVCRQILHDHGGTLTAENRPQGGAVITLTLPSALPDSPAPAQPADG